MERNKIDFIGTDNESDEVVLTISDHLDWSNIKYHLITLQNKLNAYIGFIESGQIVEEYPDCKNKIIAIEIVSEFDYNSEGKKFLRKAKKNLGSIDVNLRQRTLV